MELSEDFVHQHLAVVPATSLPCSRLPCLVSQHGLCAPTSLRAGPFSDTGPTAAALQPSPPRPRPSPVPRVPPQAGGCCLPHAWSGRAPAARPPPPCEGGTGLAALASLSGGRNFCWGILAETEVFGFFIPSRNAGNPSAAAHPAVDMSDLLQLLLLL